MARTVEPYRDRTLPERFQRWIETLRGRVGSIPCFTYLDGSPEGVVDGQKGDLAYDRTGLEYYQKGSDGGNTGWILLATGSAPTGFSGLGVWRYRTTTSGTPTAGRLEFDNLTIDSATEMYMNVTNDAGVDMSAFLALIKSGDLMYVQLTSDATQFVIVQVDTPTLSAGVYTFPLLNVEGQGTAPSNNSQVAVVVAGGGSAGGTVVNGTIEDQGLRWDVANNQYEPSGFAGFGDTTDDAVLIGGGTDAYVQWVGSLGTPGDLRARFGFTSSTLQMEWLNQTNASGVVIRGTDGGSTPTFFLATPTGDTLVRGQTGLRLESLAGVIEMEPGGNGFFTFNNAGILDLLGNATQSGVLRITQGVGPFGDVAGTGQLWADTADDRIKWTDENGVDNVLAYLSEIAAIAAGTLDGDMLYWDTGGPGYLATSSLSWDETNLALSIGANMIIDDRGGIPGTTGITEIQNGIGLMMVRFADSDGGVAIFDDYKPRMENNQRVAWWGGSRNEVYTDAAGRLRFTAENIAAAPSASFDYPLAIRKTTAPPAVEASYVQLWVRGATFSDSLLVQNDNGRNFPVGNYVERQYQFNNPTTAADPGSTFMRANTADIATVTEFYFDDLDLSTEDAGWWFAMLNVGDVLRLNQDTNELLWGEYTVDAITDNGGWWTVDVTVQNTGTSGVPFTNGTGTRVSVIRNSLVPAAGAQISGTPANNQVAVWTNATTIEGTAELTWDGATLAVLNSLAARVDIESSSPSAIELRLLGLAGSAIFNLDGVGGGANIQQATAGGTLEDTWIQFLRNSSVGLYHNNIRKMETEVVGVKAFVVGTASSPPNSGDEVTGGYEIWDAPDAQNLAGFQFIGGSTLEITNRFHGGSILVQAEGSDGTMEPMIRANPDGGVWLYHDGAATQVVQTFPDSSGGLHVRNTLTGAGLERVLTTSDLPVTATDTELDDITDTINTGARKVAGFQVFNTTQGIPVWAAGAADGSVWADATGTTANTPV